jgi:hypothetical protein
MAVKNTGLAVVWGIKGVTFTAGIVSSSNGAQTQSLRLVRTADKTDIKNDQGEVVGHVFANGRKTLSITVVPSHATVIATAQTSVDAHLIAPGTKVTVVDSQGAVVDDDYNCLTATLNATNEGAQTVDLELEAFDAYDTTVAIT